MDLDEIKRLSNEDLTSHLRNHGANVGPLTSSTRPLFEKKLFRILNKDESQYQTEEDTKCSGDVDSKNKTPALKDPPATDAIITTDNEKPAQYYSLLLPQESRDNDVQCIFTDRKAALQVAKKYPSSRFKIFQKEDDAIKFSKQETDILQSTPQINKTTSKESSKPASESSFFRGPKAPELSQFRRTIEGGEEEKIRETIWTNPRYLISSGDTPTILQENFRYNALHSCALKNQPKVAQLVLDTIQDESFLGLMYPDDSTITRAKRIKFLTDLYLNMPDKGLNETPIHFACKFGHHEVVKVLASQPQTDKCRKNKYGDTPKDIACSRMRTGNTANVTEIIEAYLEEQCYVPLVRAVDGCAPPRVMEPLSPTALNNVMHSDVSDVINPQQSPLTVKALAGPMSPAQAQKFRKSWTTPPSPSVSDKRRYAEIRRGDINKGLERIGRNLAHNLHVPWSEYWEFLGSFVDLSSENGLRLFENHLKEKYEELCKELCLKSDLDTIDSMLDGFHLAGSTKNDTSSQQNLSKLNDKAPVRELGIIFGGKTPLKSTANPFELGSSKSCDSDKNAFNPFLYHSRKSCNKELKFDANSHKSKSSAFDNGKGSKYQLKKNGDKRDIKVTKSDPFDLDELCAKLESSNFHLDKALTEQTSQKVEAHTESADSDCDTQSCTDKESTENDPLNSQKSNAKKIEKIKTKISPDGDNQTENTPSLPNCDSKPELQRQVSDRAETFYSARDSLTDIASHASEGEEDECDGGEDFEDCFDSPDGVVTAKKPPRLFINGSEPCKTDVDVLRALGTAPVSPVLLPHVFNWRNSVLSTSENTRQSWTTSSPSTPRQWSNQSTPRNTRFLHTPNSIGSPIFLQKTLLDDDEPISFRASDSESDSSLSSHDESLVKIRSNLISDFFIAK